MTDLSGVKPAIALVAPSLEGLGGQGIQARILAEALRSHGYGVTFVPIDPPFPAPVRWLRRYPYIRTVFNQALYVARLRELRKADVVHIFSASYWSFLLAPVPAILVAKLLRKPVILHYHSGEAGDHLTRWRPLITPILRLVDRIVVPSSFLQAVFASEGYGALVIPNAVDPTRFPYRPRESPRPMLLSVRNLEVHYRVENTVMAFARVQARFPEATLDIVGYGSREEQLRRLVERLRLRGVRFLGRVEPTALPAVYDAADIFVNSSAVDNQPVSILEAFAAGLPVVSTPTGDIAAMVCHGEAGLIVPPEDPEAMAVAVTRLVRDPILALRIARRARQELHKYTWSSVASRWAAAYSGVLSGAAPVEPDRAPARSSPSNL